VVARDAGRYKEARWLRMRDAVLRRDGFLCQECRRRGAGTPADTVHHIDPDAAGEFLSPLNMIALCAACHNKMHARATDALTETGKRWLRRKQFGKIKNIF